VVNIGIIGTGFARTTQIPGFLACDDARIVAIASGRRENAEAVAKEFGIPHATDNWRELIERDDIDLISIASPPYTHLEMSVAALESGKAVLCEKPMAMTANESARMVEAARASKRIALIDHELRFHPLPVKMREMIKAGEIGKIQHCKMFFRSDSRLLPDRKWDWWSDASRGGGTLGAIGSHGIDAFRWFTGTEIEEVDCRLATHIDARPDRSTGELKPVTADYESNLTVKFVDTEHTSQATGILTMSMIEPGAPENRLEVFGSKGALAVDSGRRLLFSALGDGKWTEVQADEAPLANGMRRNEWSEGFTVFARKIVEAISKGATEIPEAATFEDGHRHQQVLDAARKSHADGCAVKIAL
jgi:predicted dehydrogenase